MKDELLGYYGEMALIRRFEEEAARAYAFGKIGGFLHLYIGQEAVAVGAAAVVRKGYDYVLQTYRDHGIALALGMDPGAAMAELFGKETGCSKGLGGSMHFFDPEHGFLGGWGIVGGHVPIASGTAFKSRYMDEDRVTVCFFGEGATNIAGFHEGMHLAGLWKLPVVMVCENNHYAMGTSLERSTPLRDLVPRARGYAMEATKIEGHDVLVVRDALREAVQYVRSGNGPFFVEVETYRFRGHSMSDPGKYRSREEVEEHKRKHDPLRVARRRLLEELGATEGELTALEEAAAARVEEAVRFAEQSEPTREETMYECVYASRSWGRPRGV